MLNLNTIKPNKEDAKKRKRVGRGNSSGHGTYSGKGQKGQKSRSGVSGLKRLGMKKILLQIPKNRGFKSNKAKNQIVKISDVNKNFKNNDIINPVALLRKKLIKTTSLPVKILGKDKITLSKIQFENIKLNKNIQEQIGKNK